MLAQKQFWDHVNDQRDIVSYFPIVEYISSLQNAPHRSHHELDRWDEEA